MAGIDVDDIALDRQRRDALLWNFTVLGEAAAQIDGAIKAQFPEIAWARPWPHPLGRRSAVPLLEGRSGSRLVIVAVPDH